MPRRGQRSRLKTRTYEALCARTRLCLAATRVDACMQGAVALQAEFQEAPDDRVPPAGKNTWADVIAREISECEAVRVTVDNCMVRLDAALSSTTDARASNHAKTAELADALAEAAQSEADVLRRETHRAHMTEAARGALGGDARCTFADARDVATKVVEALHDLDGFQIGHNAGHPNGLTAGRRESLRPRRSSVQRAFIPRASTRSFYWTGRSSLIGGGFATRTTFNSSSTC